jgi:hypothetical protein
MLLMLCYVLRNMLSLVTTAAVQSQMPCTPLGTLPSHLYLFNAGRCGGGHQGRIECTPSDVSHIEIPTVGSRRYHSEYMGHCHLCLIPSVTSKMEQPCGILTRERLTCMLHQGHSEILCSGTSPVNELGVPLLSDCLHLLALLCAASCVPFPSTPHRSCVVSFLQ